MNPVLPPSHAKLLFNRQDLSNWRTRSGEQAGWLVEDGVMKVVPKTGDVVTLERFTDFYLHLEFRIPDMPHAKGQAKGNSGVFLQGRYEIQVLDSYGIALPGMGDCGAFYNASAPLVNACLPPLQWQTYDVIFRSARVDEHGEVTEQVRITVLQNGIVIQNNTQLPGVSGGEIDRNVGEPGPLLLQDHGDLVQYRNIWVVELPLKGSNTYESR